MSLPLLILTHLAAAAGGAGIMFIITRRAARTWPDHPHPMEALMPYDHDEPGADTMKRRVVEGGRVNKILLGAAVLVILIGGQSYFYVRGQQADARDALIAAERQTAQLDCLKDFTDDFIATITLRTEQTAELERVERRVDRAKTARDQQFDRILFTVIAARQDPPAADDDDLDRVLSQYVLAVDNLADVEGEAKVLRRETDTTRDENPYQPLTCAGG